MENLGGSELVGSNKIALQNKTVANKLLRPRMLRRPSQDGLGPGQRQWCGNDREQKLAADRNGSGLGWRPWQRQHWASSAVGRGHWRSRVGRESPPSVAAGARRWHSCHHRFWYRWQRLDDADLRRRAADRLDWATRSGSGLGRCQWSQRWRSCWRSSSMVGGGGLQQRRPWLAVGDQFRW